MSITWFRTESNDVFEVVESAAQAMTGAQSEPSAEPQQAAPPLHDAYLVENVHLLHNTWSVDPWRVAASGTSLAGRAAHLAQRAVRRLTWWYTLPQWQQVSEFHGAAVRVTDTLIARVAELQAQLAAIEQRHGEQRLQAVERQLIEARQERQELLKRISALEAQLAEARQQPAVAPDQQG
jgi:BMFP domain-containing protein YqiC